MKLGRILTLTAVLFAAGQQLFAEDLTINAQKRVEKDGTITVVTDVQKWNPKQTAIIICDMWNRHWCKGATARVAEMAPAMDKLLKKAREQGITIFHAPSGCMGPYGDNPARKRALEIKADPEVLKILGGENWCHGMASEAGAKWPINQNNGGCDCTPKCPGGSPWRSQIDTLSIDPDKDFITDSGVAIGSYCRQNGIKNVIVMGVHTNMCVIGRPFGLRQNVRLGNNTVLMRDMTDTMYDHRSEPFVSHFKGTDLIVEHFERYICPSILSTDITGAARFEFDKEKDPAKEQAAKQKEIEAEKGSVKVEIVKAYYGAGTDNRQDVTDKLKGVFKGSREIQLGSYNDVFGDPNPGTYKTLWIEYKIDGQSKTQTFDENAEVILAK